MLFFCSLPFFLFGSPVWSTFLVFIKRQHALLLQFAFFLVWLSCVVDLLLILPRSFCWLVELDFAIGWRLIRFFFDDSFCLFFREISLVEDDNRGRLIFHIFSLHASLRPSHLGLYSISLPVSHLFFDLPQELRFLWFNKANIIPPPTSAATSPTPSCHGP